MKKPDGTHIVGIDLGTTFSLVSTVDADTPWLIPNALGERLTPSAVAVDAQGGLLVGAAARAFAERHPERAALSFKRLMGTSEVYDLGGQSLSAIELSALVLQSLKKDAEAALGGEVSEAVITVPAYFGEAQRSATREAAALAGLECRRLINEPTAAAMSHGFVHRSGSEQLAVLDLGGGTFDVTLLEITDGIIEIQASAGDTGLGGDDFTQALAALVETQTSHQDLDSVRSRLLEEAERAKKRLSTEAEVELVVHDPAAGEPLRSVVHQSDVERAWAPLVARLREPIERALRDARLIPADISQVLLVGGATRMPVVRRLAEELFERPPTLAARPDETVALGAAVQAALMISHESVDDIVSTDIAPFSIGVRSAREIRGRHVHDLYAPILERGTVLPASRAERFSTLGPMQTEIIVEVFQGEHPVAERNTKLGEVPIVGLPPGRINEVEIRLTYDLNGLLEVETTVLQSGEITQVVLDRTEGKLTSSDRARIIERFERLKVDPRQLLPNRVALERGESAYARALGGQRDVIGLALAEFRGALGDGEQIEAARDQLNRVVRALDGA